MPSENLTDRALRSISASERIELWDVVQPGFGVRVSPSGDKTFFVMYRHLGVRRRLSLGKYPEMSLAEARREAKVKLGELASGRDPAGGSKRGPEVYTVADLAKDYLEQHAKPYKRSWFHDDFVLNRELLPACGRKRAKDVKKADVREVLERIAQRGHGTAANRARAIIRKMFSWALERDLVEFNPCAGIGKLAPELRRDRVLTVAEMKMLWWALDDEEEATRDALRLLLLTAQRRNEIRLMAVDQLEDDLWTIPGSLTKNKRSHAVPHSRQAQVILAPWLEGAAPYVLASPRKRDHPLSVGALSHAARRIGRRLGFRFGPHDLRRTAATFMPSLGIQRFVVARVLNHTDHSVTDIYDRYSYLPEKREALQRWADHLEALVAPKVEVEEGQSRAM